MAERPYSRYTREKTWAALYSQHLNAGYALVPYSATNNSVAVISCLDSRKSNQDLAKETQEMANLLLKHADACASYYSNRLPPEQAPTILAKARFAVVLARSSDYYHYHLEDHTTLKLVICGLHDSYLHLPVWETRTNRRYKARETAIALTSSDFERVRCTQFGHNILIGALISGDEAALRFLKGLPPRTQRRIKAEVHQMQHTRYRGRPLAFLTEAKRREIGGKIGKGLRRYHASEQGGKRREERRVQVVSPAL